jgi:serine/threonine-protein kinase
MMALGIARKIKPGTIIRDRYRIEKPIGRGGFGRIYLVQDLHRFEQSCALKEFMAPRSTEPVLLEKTRDLFRREANILHQINHPQVPQLLAYFEEDERLILVEEYIQGQTYEELLQARQQQNRTFSEAHIVKLLAGLLPVLHYLHNRNLIHRDISPDNIMQPDDRGRPMLIDFGLVKSVLNQTEGFSIVAGKPGFSPPEQLTWGHCGPTSDLYALGATLISLLTGLKPTRLFNPENQTWHWQDHCRVHSGTAQILNRMVAGTIQDRYPSAQSIYQDLKPLWNQLKSAQLQTKSSSTPGLSTQPTSLVTPSPALSTTQNLGPEFIDRCKQELAHHIGPIASFVLKEVMKRQAHSCPESLVVAIAKEIPDSQAANAFRQKLLA